MNLKKLHAIYLFVPNVRESAKWYSKCIGIPLSIDDDNFGLIEIGENELCFHASDQKSPTTAGGSVGYWHVDDLLKSAKVFQDHGGVIYRGPITIPGSDEGICQIKDPFGNVIGLQGKYEAK